MKKLTVPSIVALAACLAFSGCDKKPADTGAAKPAEPAAKPAAAVDEKSAIATFKTEVEAFGKWAEEKGKAVQASAATDPLAGLSMMGELVAKFKTIKTDGLPADLKAAWGDMGGVVGEMGDVFKDINIPKGGTPEDSQKAMVALMPKLMEIGPKMEALTKKGEPIVAKLKELGTKYGIDMSKVGPGK